MTLVAYTLRLLHTASGDEPLWLCQRQQVSYSIDSQAVLIFVRCCRRFRLLYCWSALKASYATLVRPSVVLQLFVRPVVMSQKLNKTDP